MYDEVYGFLPPHPANPPTKRPLVALMKQARAFGVGVVLAAQNPMDLDYRSRRTEKRGVWSNLADAVTDLDWTLMYRHLHVAPKPDAGVVLHPKLFRRLVTWAVNRRTGMGNGLFREYLHHVDERCVRRDDFQSMGSKARAMRLSDWIREDGQIVVDPAEIVFKEKDSTLIGTDGARVEKW